MRLFIGIIVSFIILASCTNNEVANYEVGDNFLESEVVIRVIDTFSIKSLS